MKLTLACFSICLLASCASPEKLAQREKEKRKQALLNDNGNELPWGRATRANDISTPMGLPMSN